MAAATQAEALARQIAAALRARGHAAYLVGGCVRDLLLGRRPKDFDVATSARPEEILEVFPGADRVGAHFGVLLVKQDGAAVEVATFRSDHEYRDGRHPERVSFETDPREDALRRDFTVNAMFLDPETGGVLDYAGGRDDLERRVIRTVGDPAHRFVEDHLRMMRAIRLAAALDFTIDPGSLSSIQSLAWRILDVSAERVHEELVRILRGNRVRRGLKLLGESGLLRVILPEAVLDEQKLEMIGALRDPSVPLAMAVVLLGAATSAAPLCRLRFSNEEMERTTALLRHHSTFDAVREMSESELKRFLRIDHFDDHLELHRIGGGPHHEWASKKLREYAPGDLWPPRLVTGDDLALAGFRPGPIFGRILEAVESAQLERRVATREEAFDFIRANFGDMMSVKA